MSIFSKVTSIFKKSKPMTKKILNEDDVHAIALNAFKRLHPFYLISYNDSPIFWANVVTAIAYAESEYDTNSTYFESTMGYNSCGLLQLSIEDNHVYRNLNLDKNNIYVPLANIMAGIIILDKMVEIHHDYIFDKGNYWSTLQPSRKQHQKFLKKFNEFQLKSLSDI